MIHDPKHLVFALSRYKFHAKMLAGRESVLEVGPGDGIGLPIMAQTVKRIVAVDWDACLIEGNRRRLKHLTNIEHLCVNLNADSDRYRPPFRDDTAHHSGMIPPTVPG
jgi:protein-L-isoaspartate O-methyltransferase